MGIRADEFASLMAASAPMSTTPAPLPRLGQHLQLSLGPAAAHKESLGDLLAAHPLA